MLKKLPEFLNAELGLPVGLGSPLQAVEVLEGVVNSEEDAQRLTLAIGSSLADSSGINLLPESSRNSKKHFTLKLFRSVIAIVIIIASIFVYILMSVELNMVKQQSVKIRKNYQEMMPHLQDIKAKLLIQNLAHHRFDIAGLLRELSHWPDKVYLTGFTLTDGNFSLTGFVVADTREAKKILVPLVLDLKKTSLREVKLLPIKGSSNKSLKTNFSIGAKVKPAGSGS